MTYLQAAVLGVVQGLTEFLPLSSSGFLAMTKQLTGATGGLWFDVFLHIGTLCALILAMTGDIRKVLREIPGLFIDLFRNLRIAFRSDRTGEEARYVHPVRTNYRKLAVMLMTASVPAGVIGFLLRGAAERGEYSLLGCGVGMLISALVLFVTDQVKTQNLLPKDIPARRSLLMGAVEGVSVLPGLSRAGLTLSYGLLMGLGRKNALRFSYLLSIPAVAGAALYECLSLPGSGLGMQDAGHAILGALCAFAVGTVCIRRCFRYIRFRRLSVFALYSVAAAIVCIGISFAG